MTAARHPSDAEREAAASAAVQSVLEAVRTSSAEVARPYLHEDVVWLGRDGRSEGPDAVVDGLLALAAPPRRWRGPEQHGAHAVLRYEGEHEHEGGGLVIETRRGVAVLVVALP